MTTRTHTEIEELVSQYGEAWNDHDLDAIMSFHPEDGSFCLHVHGAVASGKDAIRETFAESLRQWPDLNFESKRLLTSDEFLSHEMTFTATAENGKSVSFDIVDVITLRDGLVLTKDTYADSAALARQLG